jgi:hypothetical protein
MMAVFGITWPHPAPINPFLFLILSHSHIVPAAARHYGTPSRQKLGRKSQNWNPGGNQSVQGEAGGSEKSARCEIRGEIQRALFFSRSMARISFTEAIRLRCSHQFVRAIFPL